MYLTSLYLVSGAFRPDNGLHTMVHVEDYRPLTVLPWLLKMKPCKMVLMFGILLEMVDATSWKVANFRVNEQCTGHVKGQHTTPYILKGRSLTYAYDVYG